MIIEPVAVKNLKRGMSFLMFGVECFVIQAKSNMRGSMVVRFITIGEHENNNIEEEYIRTTIPLDILVVPMDFVVDLMTYQEGQDS